MKSPVLLASVLVAMSVAPLYAQTQESLRLGIVPVYDAKTTIRIFQPLATYLQQTLQRPVKLVSAPNFKIFTERVAAGAYDVLYISNNGYLALSAAGKIRAVACGQPPFHGIAVIRADAPYVSIADLRGTRIAAVSEDSLAGFIFMRLLFKHAGMDIYTDATVSFANRIEAIPFMVINGKADVGLFAEDTYARSSVYEATKDKLRVLARSMDIPQFPFAVRSDLDPVLTGKIQAAFAGIDNSSEFGKNFLLELKLDSLALADDGDYQEFRTYYQEVTR